MVKLPEPPNVDVLERASPEVAILPPDTELWRIYFRSGPHPTTWERMRDFGPLAGARFDHHHEPSRVQDRKILYAATGEQAVATCVAEVFQERRSINARRNEPWLACFALTEEVPLLDLTSKWPTRAGASMTINSGPRPRARRWSRAIYEAYPDVQGLLYASSMNAGEQAVALYERAAHILPTLPTFNESLSHPALLSALRRLAADLGYELII